MCYNLDTWVAAIAAAEFLTGKPPTKITMLSRHVVQQTGQGVESVEGRLCGSWPAFVADGGMMCQKHKSCRSFVSKPLSKSCLFSDELVSTANRVEVDRLTAQLGATNEIQELEDTLVFRWLYMKILAKTVLG